MLDALTHPLARIESVLDRAKLSLKWRFGWWDHLQILPYHGYGRAGTADRPAEFVLKGRVLDDKSYDDDPDASAWENVKLTWHRYESDEIPGAHVRLRHGDLALDAETGEDGYFTFRYRPPAVADALWQDVALELLAPRNGRPVAETARVLVPPPDAPFGVISDLDDTVVRTGATSTLKFARTIFLNNATSRRVFPGVGAFYQALGAGPDAEPDGAAQRAPIFYVSSSPWNLYKQFVGTMRNRGVPEGPVFLKDFGLDPGKFIKTGHHDHKLDRIADLLAFYPALDFVLIGDSGQEDAEIYREAVRRHGTRIKAVLLRDVTDVKRDAQVDLIARDITARGVPAWRVESTVEAAEAAASVGLIPERAVEAVRRASSDEEADRAASDG